MTIAVCADVGSTFTKVAAIDLDDGRLLGTASHRTTVDTDVLRGLAAAVDALSLPRPADHTLVCSSAGGGLRLAVVGYEPLVTAQAGHRVGLSAGARVVHVAGGRLDRDAVAALRAAKPDVVLLVGGTDGGDEAVLRHNAARLAAARMSARRARIPVVVAGNNAATPDVAALLNERAIPVVAAANVLPRIGVLNPQPARMAIREMFLRHVIGGKGLSRGPRFAAMVRAATPDVVLTAVELLAADLGGDLAVVDIGGATTDVYSAVQPDADAPHDDVAGTQWQSRTVEGDLGMRWSAAGVIEAAIQERLITADAELAAAAANRVADPALVAVSAGEWQLEARLAELAATVALRRHARGDAVTRSGARDLSRVRWVIGSGGVIRHAPRDVAERALTHAFADHAGGWRLPRDAAVVVDRDYLLAPAGLLAAAHPDVARHLLRSLL